MAASGLMPAHFPDDPRPGAAPEAAAGGPPPRAVAVRLPVPRDLRLPGGPGRPRLAVPRPLRRLAAAVRGHVAVPGRGGGGGALRARGPPALARPADLRAACSCFGATGPASSPCSPIARPRRGSSPSSTSGSACSVSLAPAQVWTLANYVLTSREARRMFGFVGAGATLGATVGGFISSALARRFGAESLLVVMAALPAGRDRRSSRQLWRSRPAALRHAGSGSASERVGLRASRASCSGPPHLRAITRRSSCCRRSSPPSRAGSSRPSRSSRS